MKTKAESKVTSANLRQKAQTRLTDDQSAIVDALQAKFGKEYRYEVVMLALQRLAESEGYKWPELPEGWEGGRGGYRGGGHHDKFTKHPKD